MKLRLFIRLIIFLQFCPSIIWGQKSIAFFIESSNSQIIEKKRIDSLNTFNQHLNSFLTSRHQQGYLLIKVDSAQFNNSQWNFWITNGKRYIWKDLRPANPHDPFLSDAGFNTKRFIGKPVQYSQITRIFEKVLRNMENQGYPFAMLYLDSIQIYDNYLFAIIKTEPGDKILIDSCVVKGNIKISKSVLYSTIGYKPGDVYSEKLISSTDQRLKELSFINITQPVAVGFFPKKAKVYLFLEKKSANRFDGIAGLLPDETRPGKYIVTGDLNLLLNNSLYAGEKMELSWQKPSPLSQQLLIETDFPVIYNLPFGFTGNLTLFKQDTSWIRTQYKIGLVMKVGQGKSLQLYTTRFTSSILSVKGLENLTVLPDWADIHTTSLGMRLSFKSLNDPIFPIKGIKYYVSFDAGKRIIEKNTALPPLLYNNIRTKTSQYKILSEMSSYFKFGKHHAPIFEMKAGSVHAENLFTNEMFLLGGIQTIKGFNESFFTASSFGIVNIEYRYMLDYRTFATCFWNAAWLEKDSHSQYDKQTVQGLGLGFIFETNVGIFRLYYALGKTQAQNFELKNAKIHLGYAAYF